MKKIFILLLILNFLSCNRENEIKIVSGKVNSINAIVDPRVELMSIIQYLAEDKNINNTDSIYKQKVDEHFKAYKNHEVVAFYKELSEKGFKYDAPPTFMLYLTQKLDKDNDKIDETYKNSILPRIGDVKNEEKFIKLLKDFSEKSKFSQFYSENNDFYKKIIEEYSRQDKIDYVKIVEDFYGKKQNSYNSILVTLQHGGQYGPMIKTQNSNYDIYDIMCPLDYKDNLPIFRNDVLFHELSHSYMNPLTVKYNDKVLLYKDLFSPIAKKMKKLNYDNWETTVNEHLVRAADIIMSEKAFGEENTNDRILEEVAKGFIYIEPIIKSLKEYESNREKYKTFEEFYPKLIDSFSTFDKAEIVEKADSYNGTFMSMLTNKGDITIIVPSKETNKDIKSEIESFANNISNSLKQSMGVKTKIISDSEYDTSYDNNNFVVLGTIEGNSFLKNNKNAMPFSIETEKISIGEKEITGNNLVFISVCTSPKNNKRGMLVFSGQNAEDMKNMRVNLQDLNGYLVIKDNKIFDKGRF